MFVKTISLSEHCEWTGSAVMLNKSFTLASLFFILLSLKGFKGYYSKYCFSSILRWSHHTVKRRGDEPILGFKNLLAEICHINTPKYKNQFSQEKSTGSYMWG